jgi:PAS domain S-box-containing protein
VHSGRNGFLIGVKMAKKKNNSDTSDLRAKAEEVFNKNRPQVTEMSHEQTESLIHELGVHQIELEMQNEELRRTQLELEQSHQDYAELFDNAPVGYFVLNPEGVIKKVNLTAARMLQREKDRIENQPFRGFLVEFSSASFFSHLEKVKQTRTQKTVVLELAKPDKNTIWAKFYTVPIIDLAGWVTGFRTAVLDITDLNQLSRE